MADLRREDEAQVESGREERWWRRGERVETERIDKMVEDERGGEGSAEWTD